ncbi:DUF420 domain-containing protein [Natranaeroarchaeum aerophilus]|uniref:DUF420 domain-containing protein n=1 Tax=Natranaeroarchaeum aerophilus TaxID=2917711 RepID=A0AAE3K7B8_9EURY|nr:DUF420 domain-containing protein [Natranaeroarchaeum aerophilus]MCL9813734.1 DUF420 domain-containing protein [Natranaeroarchaeum aerophilus]
MQAQVREHVPAVTAVLTVVSLILVFGAALQAFPQEAIPTAPEWALDAIPHLNAAVSAVAIVTILAGVRAIRAGEIERHRRLMTASFALFAGFLVMYLYRVALLGPSSFPGPETIELYVYLPILAVHILLAVLSLPFVYYALLLAATRSIHELPKTNHARVGRIAATLWTISFAGGIVIYLMLYVLF